MSLLKDLKKFTKKEKISMHIPGHKSGRGIGAYFAKNIFKIDLTELDGTDNLQNPTGILKSAQDNTAGIFGAEQTYFLTGGSSLGLRSAILGTTKRGDKLLVDRLCHKSVISAITLGGIEPIFISPEFDQNMGIYTGISPERVNCMLAEHPDICGAIITSPTYYGICSDIGRISQILHSCNKFLIVDEAHGAHFSFSKKLPQTALSLGADICIQSAHKTLPALGQCSFLHLGKGSFTDKARLERTLRMIQSTSPSYMLMTSLDESARYMNTVGRHRMNILINRIELLKATVEEQTDLKFVDENSIGKVCDKSRIVADFAPIGISGSFAERLLSEEFGIYPEMSDARYVVFIPSVSNTSGDIKRLTHALISIGGRRFKGETAQNNTPLPKVQSVYLPHIANDMEYETIKIRESVGKISAGIVSACPPGAAVLIPGQAICTDTVEYIIKNKAADMIDVIKE